MFYIVIMIIYPFIAAIFLWLFGYPSVQFNGVPPGLRVEARRLRQQGGGGPWRAMAGHGHGMGEIREQKKQRCLY